MTQYFAGKFLVQPQASVFVDTSLLANLNPGASNILAIVGTSTAGVPQQGITFTDPNQARRTLRSGDLLDAILLAFDPSSQTGGATQIVGVRVNSAIQSKVKIFDITNPVKASQTATVGGTIAAGQTFTITIGGAAVTYTSVGGDTTTTVATGLAAAINASTAVAITDPLVGVTATSAAAIVTVLARYPGVDANAVTFTAAVGTGTGTLTAGGATLTGGTGNTLATLTSDDYGLYTSQINFTIAAGSVSGNKITISLAQTTTNNVIGGSLVRDNLSRNLFTIQYTGAGSAATLTINDNSLTTSVTGAVADNLNIQFSIYTTIQQVVDAINATGKYTATLSSATAATFASAAQFDPKSAVDVKTTAVQTTGNLAALVDFLNSSDNIFCSAVRFTNPASGQPALNTTPSYFVGGSDGTTTNTDWTNAIAALQTVECNVVVPTSDQASVHAAVLTHVQFMSDTGRKPRVAIVGGALGEYSAAAAVPTQTITARVPALNSQRAMLVAPGIKYFDINGVLQTKGAPFLAALVGGMAAAVPAGTPLTHKYISNIQGLEVNFTPADQQALLLGGVAPIEFVLNKGYRIVQSKTTWLGTPNFAKNEFSTVMAIDAVVRRLQDTLDEQLVGQVVSPITLAQAVSITETVLKQAEIDKLIVGDSKNPSFKNISASTAGGDTIRVQFQMSPAIPANYILVSVSAVPYSGQAGSSS